MQFVSCDFTGQCLFVGNRGYSARKGYAALRETVDHLLFDCVFSYTVLRGVLCDVQLPLPWSNWRQWMLQVTKGKTSLARSRRKCLAAAAYYLWNERNCRVFHLSAKSPSKVAAKNLHAPLWGSDSRT
ncbi:hypothetical protein Dimus_017724 [Dionaea muscipula]